MPNKPTFASMAKGAGKPVAQAPLTPPLSNGPSVNTSPSGPIEIPTKQNDPVPVSPVQTIPMTENWKAVGSPPRRMSIKEPEEMRPAAVDESSQRTRIDHLAPTDKNWGNLGGMKWAVGNSIWNDTNVTTTALAPPQGEEDSSYRRLQDEDQKRRLSLRPENLMPSHQSRKFSLATTSETEEFQPLKDDSDSYGSAYAAPKTRSRSKSSSAIFSHLSTDNILPLNDRSEDLWARQQEIEATTRSMRRRSSTQPSGGFSGMWDDSGVDQLALPIAAQSNYRLQDRRFSHAPGLHTDFLTSEEYDLSNDYPPTSQDIRRRHSLAGPLYGSSSPSNRFLAEAMETLSIEQVAVVAPKYKGVDDYFENTEHRTKAWVEAGKNLQQQTQTQHWPLYVVEFKAGRHDFFYVDDSSINVKKGDLAIVEADRGKDLGKVIHDNIQNLEQLLHYQENHIDLLAETQFGKDVHPKRIFRLASPHEVTLLVSKSQDEAKAMSICQSKIRQKKLPMEVVDTEYQWDRRKLTLYFVADRRIDFRELVRDLFKIYKTRIWMCAVNPMKLEENYLQM